VAERLEAHSIASIYVTTLRRTHQTAAPLAGRLKLTPRVEPDLREIHLGEWDGGIYRLKAAARDPIYLRAVERQEWGEIPGAETTAGFQARVRTGLMRVAQAHPGEQVAVFVHGGVIGAALALATGAEPMAFFGAANGSISRLVVQGDRMQVRGFNDVSHLGDLA
jgi:probable phosphoglycerate mutase